MFLVSVAFLSGILLFQCHQQLPHAGWLLVLPLLIAAFFYAKVLKVPVVFACGYLWAFGHATFIFSSGLDSGYEGRDVELEGIIASIPHPQQHGVRFEFDVKRMIVNGEEKPGPKRVRLSWYGKAPDITAGEHWLLTTRLKRPHGFMNPGGFDYEGWLFRQGIRAVGYVRPKAVQTRLEANTRGYELVRMRQWVSEHIRQALPDRDHAGLILALAVGDRQAVAASQWDVLTATGTNHLMAISGLHIGLVAGLLFFITRWLWSRSASLSLRWPAPKAAAIGGLAGAFFYSALAGFAIPTQRALIMLAVVMVAQLSQRNISPLRALSTALFLVLLWDPFAVMSPGFWLSFAAVAVIVYGIGGRVGGHGLWWKWGRTQWLLAVGLAPLLLVMFQQVSIVAPLANALAVPWVSIAVVPVVLIGSVLLSVLPNLAAGVLVLADVLIAPLWQVLNALADQPWSHWLQHRPSRWSVICGLVGVALLLAPRGLPLRWLGVIWLMPLFLVKPQKPAVGEAWVTLLDVGQGLSTVVQTRHHTLVYDTGPRFGEDFDTGEAVVLPFLRHAGVSRVNTLVVGHGDNDHIGGAVSLTRGIAVDKILTSVPERIHWAMSELCVAGQRWQWDEVKFEVLHPAAGETLKGNNSSCVVRIATATKSILLTGDIEKEGEFRLVRERPAALQADILVVPHHGSATSSSSGFLDAVQPRFALFPLGYRNRYGFPAAEVAERYQRRNITILDTARHGAITFQLSNSHDEFNPKIFRDSSRYYWHWKG